MHSVQIQRSLGIPALGRHLRLLQTPDSVESFQCTQVEPRRIDTSVETRISVTFLALEEGPMLQERSALNNLEEDAPTVGQKVPVAIPPFPFSLHDDRKINDIKEFIKSKEGVGEGNDSIDGSPFMPRKTNLVGGLAVVGDSSFTRKAYTRTEVQKRPRQQRDLDITFMSREEEYPNYDDALVLLAHIANARVKCIMINTGSSTDILYFDVFQKLGISNKDILPMTSTLQDSLETQ
ncbi:hypothetical protein BHE74_00037008 [Ensete ventricosum]|nr:hypothetical protein BHE74_00037008 [Ensete ventricosum]